MNWDEINTKWSQMARRLQGYSPFAYDPPPYDPPPPPSDPIEIPPDQFPPKPVQDPMPDVQAR